VSLCDRIICSAFIRNATEAGARRVACCELLGLSLRTLERWELDLQKEDQRKGPTNPPVQALSASEKIQIVEVSTSSTNCDLSPWQIVAKLADSGQYLASESSFYRVLRERNLLSHRSKNSVRRHARPDALVATKPNEVYSWDITYLKMPTHFPHRLGRKLI
jgi:putative transposase